MIAAIAAARRGADVTIYERNDRVGKKLLATGNGQCNLTNIHCSVENYHGEDASFVKSALDAFSVQKTIDFFNSIGALTITEPDGKVFPRTLQASTILDLLRLELEKCKITVLTATPVTSIKKTSSSFVIHSEDRHFSADSVIVACGSRAAPHLGGNGSGTELLVRNGHSVTELFPVLVPVKTDYKGSRHLKGTKVDAAVSIIVNDKVTDTSCGELLFTDYGLSGPPIIQLSIPAARALNNSKRVICKADLFPDKSTEEIISHLRDRFAAGSHIPVETALIGFVNKRLITSIIADSGISDPKKASGKIQDDEIRRLADTVKGWTFNITGTLSWNDAHVCHGGVRTKDFNPSTMESLIVKGLFATGEVLDITGDCGGFNLQWAWSSGFVAGEAAAGGIE